MSGRKLELPSKSALAHLLTPPLNHAATAEPLNASSCRLSQEGRVPTFGKLQERQRSVPRAMSGCPASLADDDRRYLVTLVDVSRTGARMTGAEMPESGDDVLFRAGNLEMLATVVRSAANECAIDFATPIAAEEVLRLQA
jgi:hypothetical protein